MSEELGRIIRGTIEEIWTAQIDEEGQFHIRYERAQVAGAGADVSYLSPYEIYSSDAPKPIKDKLLAKVLWADGRRAALCDE